MDCEKVIELARKVVDAGPYHGGIDDDFCAVCHAYFLIGDDHRPDCAYVQLKQLLEGEPHAA